MSHFAGGLFHTELSIGAACHHTQRHTDTDTHTQTHNRVTAFCPGLPG